MKKTRAKVTPGPYRIERTMYGWRVCGIFQAEIAWLRWDSPMHGSISHPILEDEAKANAELFVEALERRAKERGK